MKQKLVLTKETVKNLRVRTAVKAGGGANTDANGPGTCATAGNHGCHGPRGPSIV